MAFFDALKSIFHQAYKGTYPIAGRLNYKNIKLLTEKERDDYTSNQNDPITLITSFMGLPNQCFEAKQSWSNIGKNLIGWQDNKTDGRILFNILKMPVTLPVNLLVAFFKTGINCLRIVTEFAPGLLLRSIGTLQSKLWDIQWDEKNKCTYEYNPILSALSKIFRLFLLVGQALTSPIDGIRSSWEWGKYMGGEGWGGTLLGGTLALISMSLTITAYSILLPLAIQTLGPLLLSKMPAFIIQGATTVVNALSPAMAVVGNFIMPVFGKLLALVGVTTYPGAAVGAAMVGATSLTTIGPVVTKGLDEFSNWWAKGAKKLPAPKKDTPESIPYGENFSNKTDIAQSRSRNEEIKEGVYYPSLFPEESVTNLSKSMNHLNVIELKI